MKIAFIYPASPFDQKALGNVLPSGILYLTSMAEMRYGAQVDVYDARHGRPFPPPERLNDYDLIGFTGMSLQVSHALGLVKKVRKTGFKGGIVFGGPHASVAPEHLQTQEGIDAIFTGEAEESFIEYLNYLEGRKHRLFRVWIRKPGTGWKFYPGESFIENLDSLPFPAREKYGDLPERLGFINMTTTRGCPFQCRYCQPSREILFGKRVRRRSVENIIAEIEDGIKKYRITRFSIDDDSFTYNKREILKFCEAIKPYGLKWSCQSRSGIDRETLITMRDAHCDLILVGVESGSQRVLDLMDKRNTVEKNESFIKNCNEAGIQTWCNMTVGYPGETEEDIKLSLEFIRRTQPTQANVSQVTPCPGTYLCEDAKGDIIDLDWRIIGRHVHRPKFKSLAKKQILIEYYITLMNKRSDQPVSVDLVKLYPWLDYLCRRIPYLLRLLVHWQHSRREKLQKALQLARDGNLQKAVSILKGLRHWHSTRKDALGNLGWLYLSSGIPAKAIKYYSRLLKFAPQDVEARHLLALAFIKLNDREKASRELQECLRLDPLYQPARDTAEQYLLPVQ